MVQKVFKKTGIYCSHSIFQMLWKSVHYLPHCWALALMIHSNNTHACMHIVV